MRSSLAIGDFSRATYLSIKTLRHYHRIGLLQPADVDPSTGHRRYATAQIPTAQVIRRFRALDMPLEEIHAVLAAPDLATRNELIAGHLSRLEVTLARTQEATASLRDLLQPPVDAAPVAIEHRQVRATTAAAVQEVIDVEDAASWYQGALGELYALLAARRLSPSGPGGGIFGNDLFTHERGEATIYVPCSEPVRPTGRVTPLVVPQAELAIITHVGSHRDIDRAYGTLAAYVADHALGVEGPLREYYVVGGQDTADEALWRTEIGWPIFHTGEPRSEQPNPPQ
jgi:DNA-binding transcriptional MerR regulator/effector-binding domain-containing protein